jgi:hypothetical protein
MFFHRRCPSGFVSYTAPNFSETAMNFTAAASTEGLCDYPHFGLKPPNMSTDPSLVSVARYEYAASLIVQKEWGTGSYLLSHAGRASAVAKAYDADVKIVGGGNASAEEIATAVMDDLSGKYKDGSPIPGCSAGCPLKLQIGSFAPYWHHVVVDGFRHTNSTVLEFHLVVGHSSYDDGWYDVRKPICFRHYQRARYRRCSCSRICPTTRC